MTLNVVSARFRIRDERSEKRQRQQGLQIQMGWSDAAAHRFTAHSRESIFSFQIAAAVVRLPSSPQSRYKTSGRKRRALQRADS